MTPFRLALSAMLAALALALPARAEVAVTDIAGRQVVLERPAERVVLAEARHLAVLGLIHDDPVSLVAGWRMARGLDEPTLAAYRARFPQIDAIRPVGSGNRDLSVEAIIALEPDLVVLTPIDLGDPGAEVSRQRIEQAGIPVVYVDFYSHPLTNSMPSLRILGTLTGAEARAEEFIEFYQTRLNRISDRLAAPAITRPRVFFHVHAAPQGCCSTAGTGVFNDFIRAAGGENIGAEAVQGIVGNVSLEYLLGADPDVYIATGGTHMAARGGLVLGSGVEAETTQDSFAALLAGRGISGLRAVEEGRAAGVWQMFNDSPIHISLIEFLAQSFHPELFADLDPDATQAELQERFSPVEVPGTWWVRPGR